MKITAYHIDTGEAIDVPLYSIRDASDLNKIASDVARNGCKKNISQQDCAIFYPAHRISKIVIDYTDCPFYAHYTKE